MDADKCIRTEIGNVWSSEKNAEEVRSLSPIQEESESPPFFREVPSDFTISEPEEGSCANLPRPSHREWQRILRKMEGDSSSGDERDCQLRRVKGSYCCFKPEAEASGDNDEAEIGLRDKSLRTTVEHLRHRLSQAEREIVTLKRYRSPQKSQSHETCEILRRDLLTWRDDHEKRINSQIASWQLTEQRRIHDEMENTRMMYDTIQQHLEALERQSARSYFDFRQQIDVWERRFKEDVVSLHDGDLMELREQLKAWCETQNAINLSHVREAKAQESRESQRDDAAVTARDKSLRSREAGMLPGEDNAKLLRRIKHLVKLEIQQHRDDLLKRMDRKIAHLWSAFENFQHNFYLDRDYCRHDPADTDNDDADSIKTGGLSDVTNRETAKSDANTDSERRFN